MIKDKADTFESHQGTRMSIKIIGFTGTRHLEEVPAERRQSLIDTLRPLAKRAEEVHHGDCEGADTFAHFIAARETMVVIHPPTNPKHRSFCAKEYDIEDSIIIELRPQHYLVRNHAIVDESDLLVALPKTLVEEKRSGTWATIRYARARGVKVWIV